MTGLTQRLLHRLPPAALPPSPSTAGRVLAAEARAKAREARSAQVKAHIAALQADIARIRAERGLPIFDESARA